VTRLEKRIRRLRQSPRNISSRKLISILVSLGFELRGGKGSHKCYKHPKLPQIKLTVPQQNPLREMYVKQALNAINKLKELEDNG
jgi:predicted RNA binding protein YcfA (HicA-like mRNA interferase family)